MTTGNELLKDLPFFFMIAVFALRPLAMKVSISLQN